MKAIIANLVLAGVLGGISAYGMSLAFPMLVACLVGAGVVTVYLFMWMLAMDDPENRFPPL